MNGIDHESSKAVLSTSLLPDVLDRPRVCILATWTVWIDGKETNDYPSCHKGKLLLDYPLLVVEPIDPALSVAAAATTRFLDGS